jgi:hypothetical protein
VTYIDDLLITGNDIEKIEWIMEEFKQTFEMTDLSHLERYLGVEFRISSLGIFMIQKTYVGKILKQFGMMSCNPTKLPMIKGTKLEIDMG